MHQISPAPCTAGATRGATSQSFRQAALIAHLDAFAHQQGDLDGVVQEACRVAADGIGAGVAGVLQYRADEDAFVLQAGIGWSAQMIGRTRIAADLGTTAGLAWLTGQLIHFRQLGEIDRIRVPEAMIEHGVCRLVSVPIHGRNEEAFGVLEVGSAGTGEFTRHDLAFLQTLANSVAAAVGLHASRTSRAERTELVAEQKAALAGSLNPAASRQSSVGISYQQDAQAGAG